MRDVFFAPAQAPSSSTSAQAEDSAQVTLEDPAVLREQQQSIRQANEAHVVKAATTRFEQIRFRLSRLGKSRSLHEVFERPRHFYFPQRLWIAFSVSNVATVFFFALYMFGINALCAALTSYRIQFLNILAQLKGFVSAAPTYLKLMSDKAGLLQDVTGAWFFSCPRYSCDLSLYQVLSLTQ